VVGLLAVVGAAFWYDAHSAEIASAAMARLGWTEDDTPPVVSGIATAAAATTAADATPASPPAPPAARADSTTAAAAHAHAAHASTGGEPSLALAQEAREKR
jgi:HD superfamily phosphodiesterase